MSTATTRSRISISRLNPTFRMLRKITGGALSALALVFLLCLAAIWSPLFLCVSALFSLGARIYGSPPASFRLVINLPEREGEASNYANPGSNEPRPKSANLPFSGASQNPTDQKGGERHA